MPWLAGPRQWVNQLQKVVLAYSGGLDTSVAIPWLRERYGCSVVAVCVDLGQGEDLKAVQEKALASGAERCYVIDARREFLEGYAWPVLRAGAVYEGKYLLGTSFARPLIARHLVEVARREGADAVAHGATGKGNDQVRFELSIRALEPDLPIIAPWREWHIRSREDAMAYARQRGIPVPVTPEEPYSRDQNLWHLSHEGGVLEDPGQEPPSSVLRLTTRPEDAPDEPEYVTVRFERGTPVGDSVELLRFLNEVGGRHGVGVACLVENRLVGMKSRGLYETPGGTILVEAHAELERLCLDRQTLHFKQHVALRYAELVYDGFWFSPLREALDAFVERTQETVTGEVRVRLYKGSCTPVAAQSPYSLYDPQLATFGRDEIYRHADAEGFIRLLGLPIQVRARLARRLAGGAR